jgi:hypothetical protein
MKNFLMLVHMYAILPFYHSACLWKVQKLREKYCQIFQVLQNIKNRANCRHQPHSAACFTVYTHIFVAKIRVFHKIVNEKHKFWAFTKVFLFSKARVSRVYLCGALILQFPLLQIPFAFVWKDLLFSTQTPPTPPLICVHPFVFLPNLRA